MKTYRWDLINFEKRISHQFPPQKNSYKMPWYWVSVTVVSSISFSLQQYWPHQLWQLRKILTIDLKNMYTICDRKSSLNRYICSNSQKYIVWVKIIDFSFMPKIIRILGSCSMKIFCTVNISKLNFWLLICIAKNFIWTTLKIIFSIFRFFCTLRFQIFKYFPIITNHTSMEILFIQLSDVV